MTPDTSDPSLIRNSWDDPEFTEDATLDLRVAHLRAEYANARAARWQDRCDEARAEVVELRATVARVEALARKIADLAPADDWGNSVTDTVAADIGRQFLAVLAGGVAADAPTRLHGPGCVDCGNGVTDFHRSRTDRPNPLRAADAPTSSDGGARCHAARDGECSWGACPQLRDGKPKATGRHCPIDLDDEDGEL